ncbi:MAG: hypothetical protein QM785_01180 [Pyrinomonadaceae bacterium]
MKKGYDNKKLDQIGKSLFDTEPMAAGTIDEIVAKPELFSLVRERIAADQAAALAASRRKSPVRRYVLAYSGMAMTVIAAAGAIYLFTPSKTVKPETTAAPAPGQVVSSKVPQVPDAVPEVVRSEVPPQPNTGKLSADRTTKDEPRAEKAILVRTEPVSRPRRIAEPDTRFMPVSYTGDPDEVSGGGQVVRVEMKRSSLFALGVNIPLENDDTVVKADLLIGRDGVTRAIRVVD